MRALLPFILVALIAMGFGPGPSERPTATVLRVVDGDTLDVLVDGRRERVRLIGIDTPETVDPRKPIQCFGCEAAARAEELLPVGSAVELEADPGQGERDGTSSRRLLRYVWLADGRMFNAEMIREGYAHEYTFCTPYKHQSDFKAAEREAREQGRGLWAANTCGGNTEQPEPSPQPATPPPTATRPPAPPTATQRPPTATTVPPPPTAQPTLTPMPPPPPTAPSVSTPPAPAASRVVFEAVRGAGPNRMASVTARTEPPRAGVQCSIRYFTPAGNRGEPQGVGDRRTDQDGRVTWSWIIGARTGPGTGKVDVRCGDGAWASADIEIP